MSMPAIAYPNTGSGFFVVGPPEDPRYFDDEDEAVKAARLHGGDVAEIDFCPCSECSAIERVEHVTLIDCHHPLCRACDAELADEMAEAEAAEEQQRQAALEAEGEAYALGLR